MNCPVMTKRLWMVSFRIISKKLTRRVFANRVARGEWDPFIPLAQEDGRQQLCKDGDVIEPGEKTRFVY